MNRELLSRHFEKIGARIRFRPLRPRLVRKGERPPRLRIGVSRDRRGEYFDFALSDDPPAIELLQVRPREHHLLLLSDEEERFLCGHDERHWFVAGIGERVTTVRDARLSLIPSRVREKAGSRPPAELDRRKNAVFLRQGEWFFLPTRRRFREEVILRNEPLQRRPGSKPHMCEELVRIGGERVYLVLGTVHSHESYAELRNRKPHLRAERTMVRNPEVYARGSVRHVDHSTINLRRWHQVFLNGELFTSETVIFLD